MYDDNCIFCKIAHEKLPTEFLFTNEHLVVFKDIKPHAPVHLLIVPKRHIRSINDISSEDSLLIAEMMMVARDMAEQVGVKESGYKLLFNVERGGGQVVFHLHLHLIGGWIR